MKYERLAVFAGIISVVTSNLPLSSVREALGGDQMRIIQGQLVDKQGRPVSQYPIRLEKIDEPKTKTYSAVTDFSGTYQFINLPPGRYIAYPNYQPRASGVTIDLKEQALRLIEPLKLDEKLSIKLNPKAAQTINPEAAGTINPEAARTINPEAAKVLDPGRARVLTGEEAHKISPLEASKPLPKIPQLSK
jgi:protocatechuate 3,4-dioxygenase beta subunit